MRPARLYCLCAALWAGSAAAISTPISYQGYLEDGGQPANGLYDLNFQLKTAAGSNLLAPILIDDVPVAGGVFTVQLDFGLGAFGANDRRLGIAVRAGASTGAFTDLLPDALLRGAPYAQYANEASLALQASDVVNNSIDEIDIATAGVSARNIATNAVQAAEIDVDAVGASEIAADVVGASELANNSVGRANLIGADYVSPANLNATIAANDCSDFDVPVGGGFEPGDSVVLNLNSALASNLTIVPMQVVSTNLVKVRICNAGTVSQSLTNESIRMFSIR